ncbi:unnamed protein product [Echinostoma caproni]|uniref:Na_H_Exchanger domain-containing protein n=1 Tax=Echinostoma caproni TaxID=27848 RepID=A0A183B5W2_9TREM|nr:unnamed protein product [Echinostoma caproni]
MVGLEDRTDFVARFLPVLLGLASGTAVERARALSTISMASTVLFVVVIAALIVGSRFVLVQTYRHNTVSVCLLQN